jgi:arylsulfatase A-like enzyme
VVHLGRPRSTFFLFVVAAVFLNGCRNRSVSLLELMASVRPAAAVHLDGVRAVTAPLGAELAVEIDLPDEPFLEFSISVHRPAEALRGVVRFEVHVDADGEDTLVFHEDLRPRAGADWRTRRVNLAAWRNEPVRLRFLAGPAGNDVIEGDHEPFENDVLAAWGDPSIASAAPREAGTRSSIVLVVVDTLRRDYLGFHGFRGSISPNLDWLARESVELDNTFTQAPWTKPSIASLFTSLYPDVHGLNNHEGLFGRRATDALTTGVLPPQAVTIAEALRDAGYRTAAFVGNPWLDPRYGFDQGFDRYRMEDKTESLLDDARDWLRNDASGARPWFLYLHLMDVHGPYDAPEEDFETMSESPSLDVGERSASAVEDASSLPPYLMKIPWFTDDDLRGRGGGGAVSGWGELVRFRLGHSHTLRARYAANVRDFDRRIGPFLNELRSSAWNDRTIVVLTSDHGEELLEHGGWDHGFTLFDDQIRVPLLVRLPGARGAGRHLFRSADLIDVMPTLLSAVGVDVPSGAQGRDLSSPLLHEGTGDERIGSRSGTPPPFTTISTATKHREGVYAVRTERYKLIFDSESGFASLFDLADDPGEHRDLSSRDEEQVRELERLLSRHLVESRARALSPGTAPVPDALRKRLESLGYVAR